MLPIYRAILFKEILKKGGRNEPWSVFVQTNEGIKLYVVKLFKTEFIDYKDPVTNEVLGNVLANQFDLQVPKAALIDFDDYFIDNLRDFKALNILEERDGRLKFGTEELAGVIPFNVEAFSSTDAWNLLDIDTLFAYDNLLRNCDRSRKPSNLLVRPNEAFLIDHELAFDLKGDIQQELNTWDWNKIFWESHLGRGYLSKSRADYKAHFFTTFQECLKTLDINIIDSYFKQLVSAGYSSKNHERIKNYLLKMKVNSSKFVNILKAKIL